MYNIHGHLHEDIEFSAKSLNEISVFPFENFMKSIKKMLKNANNPIAQVAKRFSETGLQRSVYTAGPKISVRERDSFFPFFFLRKKGEYAIMRQKIDYDHFQCDTFKLAKCENFFVSPINSKELNISVIKDFNNLSIKSVV